ncbi:SEL1-like repeat protein [uncultured Kingella sp.]|jgi:hypothetical protein|uniref:SEL1-like repeat protein n=1 Tax=Kingella oralis TaxID=505 RepID=UPI00259623E5|nr:SEL1-like repeat protein [uncultured Kingella sp.]
MKKSLFLALMLSAAFAHAAPADDDNAAPAGNAQYGQTMNQVSTDLQEGRAEAAFAKVKPLAEQGYPEAQYILGTMYHDGEGVAPSSIKAAEWYRKAAAQTSNEAVSRLAQEALDDLTRPSESANEE